MSACQKNPDDTDAIDESLTVSIGYELPTSEYEHVQMFVHDIPAFFMIEILISFIIFTSM